MKIYRIAGDNVNDQIFKMRDIFDTHPKYTGEQSWKKYRCETCGNIQQHNTNHWGKFWSTRCPKCGTSATWECMEEPPEGYDRNS